jgi:hypothetical protein
MVPFGGENGPEQRGKTQQGKGKGLMEGEEARKRQSDDREMERNTYLGQHSLERGTHAKENGEHAQADPPDFGEWDLPPTDWATRVSAFPSTIPASALRSPLPTQPPHRASPPQGNCPVAQ